MKRSRPRKLRVYPLCRRDPDLSEHPKRIRSVCRLRIWSRKEAYIKMLGGSVFTGIRKYPVTDGTHFLDVIGKGEAEAHMNEFSIGRDDIFCAAAGADEIIKVNDIE